MVIIQLKNAHVNVDKTQVGCYIKNVLHITYDM